MCFTFGRWKRVARSLAVTAGAVKLRERPASCLPGTDDRIRLQPGGKNDFCGEFGTCGFVAALRSHPHHSARLQGRGTYARVCDRRRRTKWRDASGGRDRKRGSPKTGNSGTRVGTRDNSPEPSGHGEREELRRGPRLQHGLHHSSTGRRVSDGERHDTGFGQWHRGRRHACRDGGNGPRARPSRVALHCR